jgi:inner membrane protein
LLLLIPAYFVQNLIKEREERQKEAVAEVSQKWAGNQVITGPVLVLPYWQRGSDTVRPMDYMKHYAYFLPDKLDISSELTPIEKHRGIYKVMLYTSTSKISGSFGNIQPSLLKIPEENIIWNEAFIKLHISDSRGLNNEPVLKWKDSSIVLSPQSFDDKQSVNSLGAVLSATSLADLQNVTFSTDINLNGSEQLLFTPVGKITTVNLKSPWSHPSFTGSSLPQVSAINKSGFDATWKSLSHTRDFPQQWKDNAFTIPAYFSNTPAHAHDVLSTEANSEITNAAFGMDLFVPVNGYQKTMRSVKYAILCILLTFTAFFLIETTNKRSVHPVHYALIGFALILFYTLLLSFSEYTGFNTAYGIAAIATVGLITWFVKGLLSSMRLSLLLSFVLILLYSYVFTILQLQDYALLLGSIGLFLALAVVMYFSRKIQW